MRAYEFLPESRHFYRRTKLAEAMAVREYAHPEEYLIRDGVEEGINILEEFKQDLESPDSLNVKWDGKAAIFWGRDETGQFLMAPMNQWNKGQKLSKQGLMKEIQGTGRKLPGQTDADFAAARKQLAGTYANQWDILEKSSPQSGFFWGDIMFDSTPDLNNDGVYEFTPNKVTYYAEPKKELGQAISRGAELFIAVHGIVKDFGVDPTSQLAPVPQTPLSALNQKNSKVFLLSEKPEKKPTGTHVAFVDDAIKTLSANKELVDNFMNYTAPRFTNFKTILRDYVNNRVKNRGNLKFDQYINTSKLSDNQRSITMDYVSKNKAGLTKFIEIVDLLISTKNKVLAELQKSHGSSMTDRIGLSASTGGQPGGEGYAKIRASGQGMKYVNPEFRSAPINTRFTG